MPSPTLPAKRVRLFLCGDVMTGRGIDQLLPHPGDPRIYERCMISAAGYVTLAEQRNGPLPRPVDFAYVWGAALTELGRAKPDVRVINLETAVTSSPDCWRDKGVNYRMHPANAPVLTEAGIDVATLANNHVLDWGYAGLAETLQSVRDSGIATAGAGRNLGEAQAPAVIEITDRGRVLVFALGTANSGIPRAWGATADKAGVHRIERLSAETGRTLAATVRDMKRTGDLVVVSVHWGGNWSFAISTAQRAFAHRLIDEGDVALVHGHSSHHIKGIEVYRGKPILYGCGDFLDDYEGIAGYEAFRGELGLMYFVDMDPSSGRLAALRMVPTRVRNLRVQRAGGADVRWLLETLNREGRPLGTWVEGESDGSLTLRWS